MAPKIYEAIGAAVRRRREVIGMTQATLAEKAGLSRTSVTNIERGGQALFVHQLFDLSRALGIEPIALLPMRDEAENLQPVPGAVDEEIRALLDRLHSTVRRS
jgi:transcriptional regulator with XRE-family HTH domain